MNESMAYVCMYLLFLLLGSLEERVSVIAVFRCWSHTGWRACVKAWDDQEATRLFLEP